MLRHAEVYPVYDSHFIHQIYRFRAVAPPFWTRLCSLAGNICSATENKTEISDII